MHRTSRGGTSEERLPNFTAAESKLLNGSPASRQCRGALATTNSITSTSTSTTGVG